MASFSDDQGEFTTEAHSGDGSSMSLRLHTVPALKAVGCFVILVAPTNSGLSNVESQMVALGDGSFAATFHRLPTKGDSPWSIAFRADIAGSDSPVFLKNLKNATIHVSDVNKNYVFVTDCHGNPVDTFSLASVSAAYSREAALVAEVAALTSAASTRKAETDLAEEAAADAALVATELRETKSALGVSEAACALMAVQLAEADERSAVAEAARVIAAVAAEMAEHALAAVNTQLAAAIIEIAELAASARESASAADSEARHSQGRIVALSAENNGLETQNHTLKFKLLEALNPISADAKSDAVRELLVASERRNVSLAAELDAAAKSKTSAEDMRVALSQQAQTTVDAGSARELVLTEQVRKECETRLALSAQIAGLQATIVEQKRSSSEKVKAMGLTIQQNETMLGEANRRQKEEAATAKAKLRDSEQKCSAAEEATSAIDAECTSLFEQVQQQRIEGENCSVLILAQTGQIARLSAIADSHARTRAAMSDATAAAAASSIQLQLELERMRVENSTLSARLAATDGSATLLQVAHASVSAGLRTQLSAAEESARIRDAVEAVAAAQRTLAPSAQASPGGVGRISRGDFSAVATPSRVRSVTAAGGFGSAGATPRATHYVPSETYLTARQLVRDYMHQLSVDEAAASTAAVASAASAAAAAAPTELQTGATGPI